ncbi:RHS repeat domain-containing protein [Dyadobacter luticola]|uniref:DUF6443 domain-containing protein n=1 Tax=Dyadobacter luticola TaxID=1979387 RepID=A0A5R9L4T1_9BACT|nr:DUF6443 domain-containing protein [Dyadobacter luticola]TLV03582.1 hypothetical protein FEN17_08255 [Dyadobacter luticola]
MIISIKNTLLLLALLPLAALGQQTNSRNYIISRTYKQSGADANDISKVVTEVRYLDGLGRPLQNVVIGQNPSGNDIIEPVEFDGAGRQVKSFLRYAAAGNGAFQNNAVANAATWYNANSAGLQASDLARPYLENFFEESPLSRVKGQRQPGAKSAYSVVKYKTNCCNELKRYDYDLTTNTISQPGGYAPGTITFVQTTDEEGKTVSEYTDLTGAMVCRQVTAAAGVVLSTYYVFDDIGLLRAVLQPQYQDQPSLTDYAFTYDYDERGRMVVKRVPGGGVTELVYDQFDRLALSRDANQLARGVWAFTKYDAQNRPVATGEITSALTRNAWAANFAAVNEHHEERSNGVTAGYTLNKTAPTNAAGANLLTIHFYDDYAFTKAGNLGYNASYYPSNNGNVKGQATGSRTRMLLGNGGAGGWLTEVIYYDGEYRSIQTNRELYDLGAGAIERVSTQYKYDLAPAVAEQKTEQMLPANVTHTHLVTYQYDHADRILSVKEKVTSGAQTKEAVTIAQRYNVLGRPQSKWFHSSDGEKFRLRTNYVQNIRGWQTDAKTVYKKDANGPDAAFLGCNLAYANGGSYSNGNISQMQWQNKDEAAFTKGLSFSYDGANRLTSSTGLMGYPDVESGIGYDKNGNIKTLKRSGAATDNLAYTYLGNRLSNVNDASGSDLGVKNGSSSYSYDGNGNMTSDGNRGATIAYNFLNLPKTVTISGKTATYDYDASGEKHKYAADTLTLKYAGNFEYRQVAGANVLDRVALNDGQAVFRKGVLKFEYSLKDHLGNVRIVFDEAGNILQRTDYYPFGLSINRDGAVPKMQNWVNRYNFLAKETQIGSGYIDLSRRFYDQAIGRFLQVDPVIGGQEDQSVYQYGWNDPILRSDPDGACPNCPNNGMSFVENIYWDARDRALSATYTVGTYLESLISNDVSVKKINVKYSESGRQFEIANIEGDKHLAAFIGVLDIASAIPSSNIAGSLLAKIGGAKGAVSEIVGPTIKQISRKLNGAITEPILPPKTIVSKDGVNIVHYTKSGDHGPPHLHVKGGGPETKIGQNGKPLRNNPSLTFEQQSIVSDSKKEIKNAIKKIGAWFNYNQQ